MNKRVMALGFFDGVHLGHGALLQKTRQLADEYDCSAAAMTFDRFPGSMISGELPALLTGVADRTALMQELYGIDEVLCPAFDKAFMELDYRQFVRELLKEKMEVCHVVCGYDYRFGKGGKGTPEKLQKLCKELDMGFTVVERLELSEVTVSSRYIRQLIAAGETEKAAVYLGHPHRFSGTVTHGQQLGRSIGIPTANLRPPKDILLPANGVYAVRAQTEGKSYIGVCNVGCRPTVDGQTLSVETWLDAEVGELYGKPLRLDFYKRLRAERKFPSLEELKKEIIANRAQAEAYFAEHKSSGDKSV